MQNHNAALSKYRYINFGVDLWINQAALGKIGRNSKYSHGGSFKVIL
jgi:hypothetical protein